MTPKVSVIIPVYNAASYIEQCLDSLLVQKMSDFEVLLINDGSTDKSAAICDDYARKDERIKVFHKNNEGVSSARNLGLDNATGEWLAFVDADDWVDDEYLSVDGYEDADVIQKGYIIFNQHNMVQSRFHVREHTITSKQRLYHWYVNYRNNPLWNKLIKRRLAKDLWFNCRISMGEDFLFFLSLINRVGTYKFSSNGHYYYRMNRPNSLVTSTSLHSRIHNKWVEIGNVNIVSNKINLPELGSSIIYRSYVTSLFRHIHYLNQEEILRLRILYREMSASRLKYVNLIYKIILYSTKIIAVYPLLTKPFVYLLKKTHYCPV